MKLRGEETNTNFKMYKSKKVWLFCSTLVCSGILLQGQIVSADTNDTATTPSTELATSASPAASQGSVQLASDTDATSTSAGATTTATSTSAAVSDTPSAAPSSASTAATSESSKTYIPAKDVDLNDKNQSVHTFYEGLDGMKYGATSDATNGTTYTPLDSAQSAEVKEAEAAKAVEKTYSSDTAAIASAVENEKNTVDGKMVVQVADRKQLPDGIKDAEVATITHRDYYSWDADLDDNENEEDYIYQFFVIENDEPVQRLIWDDQNENGILRDVTSDDIKEFNNAKNADALTVYRPNVEDNPFLPEMLKQTYLDGDTHLDGALIYTTTDPDKADALREDGRVVVDVSTESTPELVAPTPADDVTIRTMYLDGGKYYKLDEDNQFIELANDSDEVKQWLAAVSKGVGETVYAGDDYKGLLEANVKDGIDRIWVTNDEGVTNIYRINTVNSASEVPEGAAVYEDLAPMAMPETDLQTDAPLTVLDTINPGIKVSLFDYWIDPSGLNKEGLQGIQASNPGAGYTDLNEIGINKGNTLKFSPGGTGITAASDANKWERGTLISGIYSDELVDGYPTLTDGSSVDYLFNNTSGDFKDVLADEAPLKLFVSDGNGGYTFDSAAHNVYFDDNETLVYNMPNMREGDNQGQFFPLNDTDYFFDDNGAAREYSSKVDATVNNSSLNHYFGMKMSTTYIQPEDGKVEVNGERVPMVFNFSGDDDFVLYIDGKLALDLGGIHSVAEGSINFETGTITRAVIEGDDEISYPGTTLAEVLGDDWDEANKEHSIDIFYMERGNDASNLKVGFNLQIPKYHYATLSSYGVKEIPGEERYAYLSDIGGYYTQDTESYAYATSSNYGVVTDPGTPPTPPTPGPDPVNPTPTPTPETPDPTTPDPAKPTPAPTTPGTATKTSTTKATATVKPVVVTMVASDDKKANTTLPQTGDETSTSSIWGMVALAITGFFGLAFRPKRKH